MELPFPVSPDEVGGGAVIGFVSVVPGAGGSTLACLTALGLAEAGRDVALADLSPHAKVRSYLGLTQDVSPASVLDIAGISTPDEVAKVGIQHPRGLFVLPGVSRGLDASQLDSRLTQKTLVLMKKKFDVSLGVLDAPHAAGWAGFLICDLVMLVLKPDRTDLDFFRDYMDVLSRLGCGERTRIVLNKAGAPGGLRDAEVNEIVKPDLIIRSDPLVRAGCNRRQPQAATKARHGLLELAREVV